MPSKIAKADVAFLRQESQFTCCATSIASALQAHGKDVTEADVNKVLGAVPMGGATWEAMLGTVQYFGCRGTLVVPSTLSQIKQWTDDGIPVVIGWTPRDRPWAHASVVFDVDDEHNVHVMDPNNPDPNETTQVVPKAEFYAKWFERAGDTILVRRPAMAVEREVTPDGRQVMASDKNALIHMVAPGMSRALLEKQKREKARGVKLEKTQPAPTYADWKSGKKPGQEEEKPKSLWQRMKDRFAEGEGTLMQPMMTRRDYGAALRGRDTLRTAVNLPPDVERYVEEGKAQGLPEDQAWAVAWSRFCKYSHPGDEHCQKKPSEYFKGRKASKPATIEEVVAAPVGTLLVAPHGSPIWRKMSPDKSGWERQKPHAGSPDGVGPLSELGPHDRGLRAWMLIVKFVSTEPMQLIKGKTATMRTAKFPQGQSMTLDEVAKVVGPEFREMNEDPPESVLKVRKDMQGKTARGPLLAMDAFADMLKDSKFERGEDVPLEDLPEELQENVENPPPSVKKLTEKMQDKTSEGEDLDGDDVPFDLFFNGRQAAVVATGKYGFPKSVENACTAGVNKLSKFASKVAKALYAKDEQSPAFLSKHAARGGSKTASMLLKAMEGIGPMAALGKIAGKSGNGLYGFSEKSAKLGLDACTAVRHEAGVIAADLFARKGADPVKMAGYFAANSKKAKCAYSAMLGECCPDLPVVASAKGKKASDFLASGDSNDDVSTLIAELEADESTHPSFLPDEDPTAYPKC